MDKPSPREAAGPTRHVAFADEVSIATVNAVDDIDTSNVHSLSPVKNWNNNQGRRHHPRAGEASGGDEVPNDDEGEVDSARGKRGSRNRHKRRSQAKSILKALVMEANAETDIQEQLRTRAALLEAEEEASRIHMERLQLEEQFELVQPIHDFEKEVRALRSRKETRTASTQSEEEYPEIQTEQTTKQTASAPDTRDVERAPARAEIQENNENIAKRPNRPSTVTRIFESLGGWRQCVLKVCVLLIVFLLVRRFAYRLR